jgi:hypothetical protein
MKRVMSDYWVLIILAAYVVLTRWILPRFGVGTCMTGSCPVESRREKKKTESAPQPSDTKTGSFSG